MRRGAEEPPPALLERVEAAGKRARFAETGVPVRLWLAPSGEGGKERIVQILDNVIGPPPVGLISALEALEEAMSVEESEKLPSPPVPPPASIPQQPLHPHPGPFSSASSVSTRKLPLPHRPVGTLPSNSMFKYLKGGAAVLQTPAASASSDAIPALATPAASSLPAPTATPLQWPPPPPPHPLARKVPTPPLFLLSQPLSQAQAQAQARHTRVVRPPPSWSDDSFSQSSLSTPPTPLSAIPAPPPSPVTLRFYTYPMTAVASSTLSSQQNNSAARHVLFWVRPGCKSGPGCLRLHDNAALEHAIRLSRELNIGLVAVFLWQDDDPTDSRRLAALQSAVSEYKDKLINLRLSFFARRVPEQAVHSFFALWTRAVPTHCIVAHDLGDKLAMRVSKAIACPLVAVDDGSVVPRRSISASVSRAEYAHRFRASLGESPSPAFVQPALQRATFATPGIIANRKEWTPVDWLENTTHVSLNTATTFGETAALIAAREGALDLVLAHLRLGTLSALTASRVAPMSDAVREWEYASCVAINAAAASMEDGARLNFPVGESQVMPGDIVKGETPVAEFNTLQRKLIECGLLSIDELKQWTRSLAQLCGDAEDLADTWRLLLSKFSLSGFTNDAAVLVQLE